MTNLVEKLKIFFIDKLIFELKELMGREVEHLKTISMQDPRIFEYGFFKKLEEHRYTSINVKSEDPWEKILEEAYDTINSKLKDSTIMLDLSKFKKWIEKNDGKPFLDKLQEIRNELSDFFLNDNYGKLKIIDEKTSQNTTSILVSRNIPKFKVINNEMEYNNIYEVYAYVINHFLIRYLRIQKILQYIEKLNINTNITTKILSIGSGPCQGLHCLNDYFSILSSFVSDKSEIVIEPEYVDIFVSFSQFVTQFNKFRKPMKSSNEFNFIINDFHQFKIEDFFQKIIINLLDNSEDFLRILVMQYLKESPGLAAAKIIEKIVPVYWKFVEVGLSWNVIIFNFFLTVPKYLNPQDDKNFVEEVINVIRRLRPNGYVIFVGNGPKQREIYTHIIPKIFQMMEKLYPVKFESIIPNNVGTQSIKYINDDETLNPEGKEIIGFFEDINKYLKKLKNEQEKKPEDKQDKEVISVYSKAIESLEKQITRRQKKKFKENVITLIYQKTHLTQDSFY